MTTPSMRMRRRRRSSSHGIFHTIIVLAAFSAATTKTAAVAAATGQAHQDQQQQKQQEQQSDSTGSTVTGSSGGQAVIEWLQTKDDGYFNTDKVAFKDGGMFALQDIDEGEVLMVVPPAALLGPREVDIDEEDDEWAFCATARRLVHEYAVLGADRSEYWPYVRYVFEDFAHGQLPHAWSLDGKDLVADIVGEALEPQAFGSGSYEVLCGDDEEDEEEEEEEGGEQDQDWQRELELLEAAWRIVVSRGWHRIMVPVFDMVNHRNGAWLNVDRDTSAGMNLDVNGDYRIVALQKIAAGSQLHNSYNQCRDVTCHDISETYVTSHIFSDYGFVEQYPRRFAFDTGYDDDEDLGMVFEIDNIQEEAAEEEKVTWLTGHPNAKQVAWLEAEWKRLKDDAFFRSVADRAQRLNSSEGTSVMEYYQALTGALERALQQSRPIPAAARHEDVDGEDGIGENKADEL